MVSFVWVLTGAHRNRPAPGFYPIGSTILLTATLTTTAVSLTIENIIAFGRHLVLHDMTSWWIGMGLSAMAVAIPFRIISFPTGPNQAAVVGLPKYLGLDSDGGHNHPGYLPAGRSCRRTGTPACPPALACSGLDSGPCSRIYSFHALWRCIARAGPCEWQLHRGPARMAILYRPAPRPGRFLRNSASYRKSDRFLAFVVLSQIALAFAHFWSVLGGNRYSLISAVAGTLIPAGYLLMVFGLLSDYVLLLRRERTLNYELGKQIEDLHRTEAALRRSNADLEQFAYVASHDLREPLRNMSVFVELLVRAYRRNQLDTYADRCLEVITAGARRMEVLIAGLLAYARIRSPYESTLQETVDLNTTLDEAVSGLTTLIADANATIVREPLPIVPRQPWSDTAGVSQFA